MRTGRRDASNKSVKNVFTDYKPKIGVKENINGTIIYEDKQKGMYKRST